MPDIIRAEWLRYRLWVLLYALAHLLALAFLNRLTDLGQQPVNVRRVFAAGYVVTGLLLGLHQMGTWRRPNQWLNLLHRPVAPWRIGLGLFIAGCLGLLVAIMLPLLLAVAWQAYGTARVVDLRHVLIPLAAFLIAMCAYFAGAYGLLADRRYAASGLVLILWIMVAKASGPAAILLQLIASGYTFALAMLAFRPDLGSPPRSLPALVLVAIPVQAGIYVLILLGGFIAEMGWIMSGTHPGNMVTPPKGGFTEAMRMSPRDRMLAGLEDVSLPDAPLWREQVALSEVHVIERPAGAPALRNEMSNSAPMAFEDHGARIQWTFSHRHMRYQGVDMATGLPAGILGAGEDNAAFPALATPLGDLPGLSRGDVILAAGPTLYRYVAAVKRILPLLTLPSGERIVRMTPIGGSVAVLSDRAIYLYDGRYLTDGDHAMHPRQRVAIPGHAGDLSAIGLVELVDGYLVSFTFAAQAYDMVGVPPYLTVLRVNDQGMVTPVATRALGEDYPAIYRYRAWWPSPVIHALRLWAVGFLAPVDDMDSHDTPPVPAPIRTLAWALMGISLLWGAWLARRRELSTPARLTWTLACGLIGLPAVASLWLILPAPGPVPRLEHLPHHA